MPNKYFHVGEDLTEILEGRRSSMHDEAPISGKFTGSWSYQKAGTDTENETLQYYQIDGVPATAVKKGWYPIIGFDQWNSMFWSAETAGTYTLTRTDTTLTVGSSTFYSSDFACKRIPSEIIILAVGPGGGAGGYGYYVPEKDVYYFRSGGAGGGGGMAIARINIKECHELALTVGSPGTAGTNGTNPDDRNGSQGGWGNLGTSTTVVSKKRNNTSSNITLMIAERGAVGQGGNLNGGSKHGGSGNGGGFTISANYPTIIKKSAGATGGGGCCYEYTQTNSNKAEANNGTVFKFTSATGTGAPAVPLYSNPYDGTDIYNESDWNICNRSNITTTVNAQNAAHFYCGGCSYGAGAYPNSHADYGGGGAAGNNPSGGGNGLIALFY